MYRPPPDCKRFEVHEGQLRVNVSVLYRHTPTSVDPLGKVSGSASSRLWCPAGTYQRAALRITRLCSSLMPSDSAQRSLVYGVSEKRMAFTRAVATPVPSFDAKKTSGQLPLASGGRPAPPMPVLHKLELPNAFGLTIAPVAVAYASRSDTAS